MSHTMAVVVRRGAFLRARTAWRYPEWWCLALSGLSWIALAATTGAPTAAAHHAPAPLAHASAWTAAVSGWVLMVMAMMFPLAIGAVRMTAERSLWRRRHRAIAEFLIGYLAVWSGAGTIGIWLLTSALAAWPVPPLPAASLALAAAALWQLTPVKRRALRSCHRTAPLAGRGWRADRDCLVYGVTIGARCFVSCWAMMLACVASAHSAPIMAATTVAGTAERYSPRSLSLRTSVAFALLACVYAFAR